MLRSIALALLLTVLYSQQTEAETAKPKVVCYYTNWAIWRPGDGKYGIDDIPASQCTDIIYSFVVLNGCNIKSKDPDTDINKGGFKKFVEKCHAAGAKAHLAVGGWTDGSAKYSRMSADPTCRQQFVDSAVGFLEKYKFDGFDVDWEYPAFAQQGGRPADKDNYRELIKSLREGFNKVNKDWQISIAVPTSKEKLDAGYHVYDICQMVDNVNVMAYDLRGYWDGFADVQTPLHARPDDTTNKKRLTVADGMKQWTDRGCAPHKLILGTAFYGRSFRLAGQGNTGLWAKTTGKGNAGPYTREAGYIGYYEVCDMVKNKGYTRKYDSVGEAPYAFKGNQWIGYDDPQSLKAKADFAKEKGYGGVMVWTINLDDFHGKCGEKNAMVKTLHKAMQGYQVPCTNPAKQTSSNFQLPQHIPACSSQGGSTSVEPSTPTTAEPASGGDGSGDGSGGDSGGSSGGDSGAGSGGGDPDCSAGQEYGGGAGCPGYWRCVHGTPHQFQCPFGLVWNPASTSCDYDWNVNGQC